MPEGMQYSNLDTWMDKSFNLRLWHSSSEGCAARTPWIKPWTANGSQADAWVRQTSLSFKTPLWLIIDYKKRMKGRKSCHPCERPAGQTPLWIPACISVVTALSRAAKSVRQNAGTALTERHMQGYEWLHLRGNCCQAGASYLVSFSLLAIYGRSGSALRRRYLIWILMSFQVKLGLSGDPRGEEKTFTYDCFNSLCLIVNSLLHNKGERNINAIKGNGIMIPFAQSLKSFFTVL